MIRIENEISVFKEDITVMSNLVRKMFILALEVVETGDKEKALKIIDMDEYVNNDNEEISDKATEILSLLAPVASDLRIIIAGIKISTDLERIGDYAKSIARFVIKNDKLDPQLMVFVKPLSDKFIKFFDQTMLSYKNRDAKAAMELPAEDEAIDSVFLKMHIRIDELLKAGTPIDNLVTTVGMLRNFQRAGDHTKNICEHIIFEVKGQHYDFG